MCGISGILSFKKIVSNIVIKEMVQSMNHRGPDSNGFYSEENVLLGHNRLSILDLSVRANQPMTSQNGRFVIVYNGEVYNYRELASTLKYSNPDLNFNSASDTETILEGFALNGISYATQLNGMFAFAIWDKKERELYLCRDRMGIKPLYYYNDGNVFAFASEIKALKKVPELNWELDTASVFQFLNLGMILTPNSIYKNVKKLEAGSVLKVSSKGVESYKYWSLSTQVHSEVVSNEKQAIVKLSDLIMSSVQYHLRSDVPFGVFLSGGIDSSLVTASAVQLTGDKLNTFSIGFEEDAFNESTYARAVAKYLGTNHHEFIVSQKEAVSLMNDLLDIYDEPFADSSAIPTLMVSRLAKNHVTVTLSGEGGDELFHGYGSYVWANRLDNRLLQYSGDLIAGILCKMNNRYRRAASLFQPYSWKNIRSHIHSQEQYYFSNKELEKCILPSWKNEFKKHIDSLITINSLDGIIENLKGKRNLTAAEQQSIFDLKYYLQDDLLTKVDRASMRHSLETRVPYLDHRIVEFALNLSPELKMKGGVQKYILKEILYQYVPKAYFDRPKKGFAIPLSKWLRHEMRDRVEEEIKYENGFVDVKYTRELYNRYLAGEEYLYNRIWLILCLNSFLKKHF